MHSSYAMATSPSITLEGMAAWAAIKGIDVLAASDFTHPAWLAELKGKLVPAGDGLYTLREPEPAARIRFMLGTEVSCVYPQDGRSHRLHLLLFAPDFEAVDRLCAALERHGNLASDGRPILRLSGRDVVEAALAADPRCEVIPAHAWTPWYSVYGSKGGFDSLAACFGDLLPHVHAIETGLSSDPAMNWRVRELDDLALVSFSDAHSPARMGRELTVFAGEPGYASFREALRSGPSDHIGYTVEFYPEEGKYHYDGHRKCAVCRHPAQTLELGERCPVCGRTLTLGVLHRMEALSTRAATAVVRGEDGLLRDPSGVRPPFRRLVPLREIIAEAIGRGPQTKRVDALYLDLVHAGGSELAVLERMPPGAIAKATGERIAEGVAKARVGDLEIAPGYDGLYGSVRLWPDTPD
jgi:uncharacterized protein (TIGR00375 family)